MFYISLDMLESGRETSVFLARILTKLKMISSKILIEVKESMVKVEEAKKSDNKREELSIQNIKKKTRFDKRRITFTVLGAQTI